MKKSLFLSITILLAACFLFVNTTEVQAGVPAPEYYCVSGAGNTSLNGTYAVDAYYNGKVSYSLIDGIGLIFYSSTFSDWDIGPEFDDFSPDYVYKSTAEIPPEGIYLVVSGKNPAPKVTKGICVENPQSKDKEIEILSGNAFDGWAGIGGLSSSASGQSGTLKLNTPANVPYIAGHDVLKAYDVKILDEDGKEMDKFFGLLYIYFNLTETQVEQLANGDLMIKRWTEDSGWKGLTTFLAIFEDTGRAAALGNQPGIYALVETK